jgi:hypothetical protein
MWENEIVVIKPARKDEIKATAILVGFALFVFLADAIDNRLIQLAMREAALVIYESANASMKAFVAYWGIWFVFVVFTILIGYFTSEPLHKALLQKGFSRWQSENISGFFHDSYFMWQACIYLLMAFATEIDVSQFIPQIPN